MPVDGRGQVSLDDLRQAMTPETILVSMMHTNNEIINSATCGNTLVVAELSKYTSIALLLYSGSGCGFAPGLPSKL